MRTRVVLRRPDGTAVPVAITTDATATAGDLADALTRADGGLAGRGTPVVRIHRPEDVELREIPREASLSEAGFRAGSTIEVATPSQTAQAARSLAVARLVVVAGPDSGREIDLTAGVTTVGRGADCDLRLSDQQVSRLHARLLIGEEIEVADAGSANGVLIDDEIVARSVLRPDDTVVLGGTEIQVQLIDPDATTHTVSATGAMVRHNRSPRMVERYADRSLPAPEVPSPAQPGRFPGLALIAPLAMGVAMYSVTRNSMSLMFVALSPVMMLANWWNGRSTGRRRLRTETAAFHEGIDLLRRQVEHDHLVEREARLAEAPATRDTVGAALALAPVLWSQRPDEAGFLTVRLGIGTAPSRTTVDAPNRGSADAVLWEELQQTLGELQDVTGVPHVADLTADGVLGIAGEPEHAVPVARAVLAQIASLHSPAELVIAGLASRTSAPCWLWLSWLPHVDSAHSPLGTHLASGPAACTSVVTQIEELIAQRRGATRGASRTAPWVVVLVEDDAPAERGRLVRIAEEGPAMGVVVIWCARSQRRLPASCRIVLIADEHGARTGRTADGTWHPVTPETLDEDTAVALGRHLAGVADAGALTLDESDLPRAVGYLSVAGAEIATEPEAVIERWRETGSLLDRDAPPVRRSHDAHLRGTIGQGADGEFVLDLRTQGPHALVGGTTGAGKSEFLQAWVLGMAAAHSPDRITFLFVDYKGGAAFADCVDLPHCVGLVTDLAGHLVRRALTSLRAELRHREHLLASVGAKDLLAMERTGDPRTPPALVIVVDEFAALVQEIPEFVDGVVDVAQRGRSLGLHLVLATQRPAGVIKDNLRANTNLRIALRMADESDSSDVLGSPMAAHIDPRTPGRGAVRTGPGRLTLFQTGYVGGRATTTAPPPTIGVESLTFGPGEPWTVPPHPAALLPRAADGPTEAARVVATLREAADRAGVPAPRRPWLDEIPTVIPLDTTGDHTDGDLPLGTIDVPAEQAQHPYRYLPDDDGALAVFGTTGSGKSTVLRTIATAAATARGHVRIYGLDFATGALAMLEALPQVGSIINGSDTERVTRVLTELSDEVDTRAAAFSAARADDLDTYRGLTGSDLARVFLLVDGFSAFRDGYENQSGRQAVFAALQRLVTEGRAVGVHVVLTADRSAALPSAFAAAITRRLVLRQADENAYSTLGAPRDVLTPESHPGRAVLSGSTDFLQIAVISGNESPKTQADATLALAGHLEWTGAPCAPEVRRLSDHIALGDLPTEVDGKPVLGVADDDLAPVGFDRSGVFLVAGLSGSGRTTALRTLTRSLRQHGDLPIYFAGPRGSTLRLAERWDRSATGPSETNALAKDLLEEFERPASASGGSTLVIEGVTAHINGEADSALVALIRAARANGHLIVAEAESSTWASSWVLANDLKSERRGIVLQPDQADGDQVLRTSFPRVKRADNPPGRGYLAESGRVRLVQLPITTSDTFDERTDR